MPKERYSMNARIKDKIAEIRKYLNEFGQIVPDNVEHYIGDFKAKAACERYAERIIKRLLISRCWSSKTTVYNFQKPICRHLTFFCRTLSSPANLLHAFRMQNE